MMTTLKISYPKLNFSTMRFQPNGHNIYLIFPRKMENQGWLLLVKKITKEFVGVMLPLQQEWIN